MQLDFQRYIALTHSLRPYRTQCSLHAYFAILEQEEFQNRTSALIQTQVCAVLKVRARKPLPTCFKIRHILFPLYFPLTAKHIYNNSSGSWLFLVDTFAQHYSAKQNKQSSFSAVFPQSSLVLRLAMVPLLIDMPNVYAMRSKMDDLGGVSSVRLKSP